MLKRIRPGAILLAGALSGTMVLSSFGVAVASDAPATGTAKACATIARHDAHVRFTARAHQRAQALRDRAQTRARHLRADLATPVSGPRDVQMAPLRLRHLATMRAHELRQAMIAHAGARRDDPRFQQACTLQAAAGSRHEVTLRPASPAMATGLAAPSVKVSSPGPATGLARQRGAVEVRSLRPVATHHRTDH